jgi:hypothetical protein
MIRRSFLWHGSEDRQRGQCLVNWKHVQCPKSLGGFDILDLDRFGHVLRLRWQWHGPKSCSKPWNGITIPSSATKMALFKTCTSTTLGNGETTSVWHDQWLNRSAPRDIVPLLFRLAWRKNSTVSTSLRGWAWMRGFQRLSTVSELQQFITLRSHLSQIQLAEQADDIKWRFTTNGSYSAQSAYLA